ncbi:MAG: hypothetical protein KH135_01715, partial [Firmicutes bacterium]|nr:hypothetical protein [Bacillota bacterium]
IIPKNNSNLEVASNYQEDREAILSDIRYFRLRGNFSKILVGAYTLFTAAGLIFWVQGNPASVMVGIGTTYIGMSGTAISYALMKDYESSEIESEEELKNLTR